VCGETRRTPLVSHGPEVTFPATGVRAAERDAFECPYALGAILRELPGLV